MNGLTSAGRRRSTTFVLVAAIALVALATVFSPRTAGADTLSEDFEGFNAGDPDGQDSWEHTGAFDYEIVEHGVGGMFGNKSLRVSNSVAAGSFGDQLFSAPLMDESGETSASDNGESDGTRQNRFSASWGFTSAAGTDVEQEGLAIGIAADRGDGARMSYIVLSDSDGGFDVTFWDVEGQTDPATFVPHEVASDLPRTAVHTVGLDITFVDGPSNDIVDVYVNGSVVYTGTTWEDYFLFDDESQGIEGAVSRTVDSLLFLSRTPAPGVAGGGFYIDNLILESSMNLSAPEGVDVCPVGCDFGSIQHAVNSADPGDTIVVGAGTYNEDVVVNEDVTLDGSAQAAKLTGSFNITTDDVTIRDFDITNPNGTIAVKVSSVDGAEITGSHIHDVGSAAGSAVQAVYLENGVNNVLIENNTIDQVGNTSGSNKGIFVGDSVNGPSSMVTLANNTISGVIADDAHEGGDCRAGAAHGDGAYGILVNHEVTDLVVSGNTILDITGCWVHAIGLEGPTPGASVTGNIIEGLFGTKTVPNLDSIALFFEANPDLSGVTVEHNQFNADVPIGVASALGTDVTAEANWWGHKFGPTAAADAGPGVDFTPWCTVQDCSVLSNAPSGGGGGGGGAAPSDELPAEGTIEDTGIDVPVEGGDSAEVEDGFDTSVEAESSDGSNLDVTAPDGSLPDGTTLAVWAIDGIEDVLVDAPAPEGADIVLGFVVQALDEDGNEVEGPFDPPLELVLTIPADQVPAGLDLDHVVLVAWNGEEWVEVEAVGTLNPDGSLTLVASVDHLTIFAAAFQELTGVFTPEPAATGTSLATWGGGTFEQVDAALAAGDSIWVFVDGVASGYTVGGPDFVNAKFTALYPGGMPAGTIVIVAR